MEVNLIVYIVLRLIQNKPPYLQNRVTARAVAALTYNKYSVSRVKLHYITRDDQNVVASFFIHIFWLPAWQHIFEISYTDRYYVNERITVWNVSKFLLVRDL